MLDRVPSSGKTGRVKLTLDDSTVLEGKLEMADEPIQDGTALNKANLLSDSVAAKYGLPTNSASATPNAVFNILSNASTWHLIQEYTTAGTYTYTIPSGITELGICAIGGGGGGAAQRANGTIYASGGASGVVKSFILDVSELSSIPIVVGAGGAGGSCSRGSSYASANGNNGNSTSVNGIVCSGGEGGKTQATSDPSSLTLKCASGGQGAFVAYSLDEWNASYIVGGTPVTAANIYDSFAASGGRCLNSPAQSVNPFESDYSCARKLLLSAGASTAGSMVEYPAYAPNPILPDIKGGNAVAMAHDSSMSQYTPLSAGSATGYGNGGGAISLYRNGATSFPQITGGAGSDGAVFIYAR